MNFFLPSAILQCINTLKNAGYEAFVVGGAVRDMLMQITPHDYDIATNARPNEIKNLFQKTIPTGEKHGTITVLLGDCSIEVTTYRTDGCYNDARHPEDVSFKNNISDDLSRRDFTVNAFAYNPDTGLVDLFDGLSDLKNKILRTVGDATTRFNEDALRIMRAFRFASQLQFTIEDCTLSAALRYAYLLENISAERIGTELIKLLCGLRPEEICPLLKINALQKWDIHRYEGSLQHLKKIPAVPQARFALFCYLTKNEPNGICKKLKFSNKFLQESTTLHSYIINGPLQSAYQMRKYFPTMSVDLWNAYFDIGHELWPTQENGKKAFAEILEKNLPCKLQDLRISGNDLSAMGISGLNIGKTLQYLLNRVLEEPQLNHYEALKNLAKDFIKTL